MEHNDEPVKYPCVVDFGFDIIGAERQSALRQCRYSVPFSQGVYEKSDLPTVVLRALRIAANNKRDALYSDSFGYQRCSMFSSGMFAGDLIDGLVYESQLYSERITADFMHKCNVPVHFFCGILGMSELRGNATPSLMNTAMSLMLKKEHLANKLVWNPQYLKYVFPNETSSLIHTINSALSQVARRRTAIRRKDLIKLKWDGYDMLSVGIDYPYLRDVCKIIDYHSILKISDECLITSEVWTKMGLSDRDADRLKENSSSRSKKRTK